VKNIFWKTLFGKTGKLHKDGHQPRRPLEGKGKMPRAPRLRKAFKAIPLGLVHSFIHAECLLPRLLLVLMSL